MLTTSRSIMRPSDHRPHRRFHTAVVRIIRLRERLMRGPVLQRTLTADLGVLPRTLRRDLATLVEAGVPLYDELQGDGQKLWGILR